MADKEATVYIVDVGKSMGLRRHGRKESDLEWAMKYVWDKISTTVASGRKTACLGVVALRSDETKNSLSDEEAYENISVLQPIGQALMQDIRNLSKNIKPSSTNQGDAISALVVAVQLIAEFTKKLKYKRKIVLVTNADGEMDTEGVDAIAEKLKQDGIDLIVLGADFDDPEFGVKEEDKDPTKQYNEKHFKSLTEMCDGVFGSLAQAVGELGIPRLKTTRPVQSYRGLLTLGDQHNYDTAMCIDVERFPRTMVARPPTASNFVIKADTSQVVPLQPLGNEQGNELASVKQARAYTVTDESAEGGKREVERDDLAKGYAYGQTAVPIAEADENVTKFESTAGLEIMGFIPRKKYKHYMNMSRSNIIIAQRTNAKAIIALSSFIHSLWELDNYAIARLVPKENKAPVIVLLAPSIEHDYECLIDVELPFAEDVRSYKFPPLDKIITLNRKTITEHRNLPSDDLKACMDDYVDAMDISNYGRDDEGEPCEYMPMDETFSPVLHRINQAIAYRAVHPDKPVPAPAEVLTRYMTPPKDLLDSSAQQIQNLKEAADVKKVPPQTSSRRQFKKDAKNTPLTNINIPALLSERQARTKNRISPENAIPEFKQLLAAADDIDAVKRGCDEFKGIIEGWIKSGLGDAMYGRVLEGLGVLRGECVDFEVPGVWNTWMVELKGRLKGGEMGGDRGELWYRIRAGRMGLIGKAQGEGGAGEEEARNFLKA